MPKKKAGGGGARVHQPTEHAGTTAPRTIERYGVGIDCHSKFVVLTVLIPNLTEQTEKRHQKHFPASTPGLVAGHKWCLTMLQASGLHVDADKLHYTIESTACYHFPLIRAWGGLPSVVNPNLIKAGSRKTDDIDSHALAQMDQARKWPLTYTYPDEQMVLRVLLRLHHKLSRLKKHWSNSLNSQMLKFGVSFSRLGSIVHNDIRPYVEDYLRGVVPVDPAKRECVPLVSLPSSISPTMFKLFDWHDEADNRAKLLWKSVEEQLENCVFRMGDVMMPGKQARNLLETIPGFGPQTATWWLGEVGDVQRFPNDGAAAAWAGCDLSLRISAGEVTSFTRRRGHSHIHWLTIQAAQSTLRTKTPLGLWGQARINRGGKGAKQRAAGAVARRLCQAAYQVMFKGRCYAPGRGLLSGEDSNDQEERRSGGGVGVEPDEAGAGDAAGG